MSPEIYRYDVMVDGLPNPIPYKSLDEAYDAIRWFMPCKVTIEAVKRNFL